MLKLIKIFLIIIFSFMVFTPAFATPPKNLSLIKKELVRYHNSGRYYQDISSVIKEARDYMQFRLIQNERARHPQKLALVMDIDETVLSNYTDMIKLNFGGTMRHINALEGEGHDAAIPYTRSLYNFARRNDIAVFFITGRREPMRAATARNLAQAGFHGYQKLYLKPVGYHKKSAEPYKVALRRKIEREGYDIIVNIGDQESDLKGSYADMSFKLPNPYYSIS